MAIALRSHLGAVQASGATVDLSVTVVAGDSLIVLTHAENIAAGTPGAHTLVDVTDGETFVQVSSDWNFTNEHGDRVWKLEVVTGGTKTLRLTAASPSLGRVAMVADAFTATGGLTFDQEAHTIHQGAGTVWNSGNTPTTTVADELLYGTLGTTWLYLPSTPGIGWTETFDGGGTRPEVVAQYRIVTSTGAYSADGTKTGPNGNLWGLAGIVTFSEVGGGPAAHPVGPFVHPFYGPFRGPIL